MKTDTEKLLEKNAPTINRMIERHIPTEIQQVGGPFIMMAIFDLDRNLGSPMLLIDLPSITKVTRPKLQSRMNDEIDKMAKV